jgi:hypothetical protein
MKPPLDNPRKRAALTPEERVAAQKQADEDIRGHWKVENGEIVFDGKARSLCTMKDYANFEMLVDWKIPAHGDSGIYLRGSPQVQIWDPHTKPTKAGSEVGSGAFYNNQKNPRLPLKVADKPIGEWNRFRILIVGEHVHVFLNGELVTRRHRYGKLLGPHARFSRVARSNCRITAINSGSRTFTSRNPQK